MTILLLSLSTDIICDRIPSAIKHDGSLKHYNKKFVRSENNLSTCSYSVPSPKLTSSIEHELASCFTNLSSRFLASGLLLNVGILLPGNSFSVALRMRVRLMNKKKRS